MFQKARVNERLLEQTGEEPGREHYEEDEFAELSFSDSEKDERREQQFYLINSNGKKNLIDEDESDQKNTEDCHGKV